MFAPLAESQKARYTLAIALAVVGVGAFWGVSTQGLLWWVQVLATLGVIALALAMLWLTDRLQDALGDASSRAVLVVSSVGTGLGVLAAAGSASWNWGWLGVLAAVLVAVGLTGLYVCLKRGSAGGRRPQRLWFGAEAILGGAGLVWALDSFTRLAWLGLALMLLGLIVIKVAAAAILEADHRRTRVTLRWSFDLAALGVLALLGGATSSNQLAVLLGVAGVFVGLSVFGIAMMHVRIDTRPAVAVTIAGLVAVIGGLVWLRVVFGFWGIGLVLASLVVVVGAWFVWRGDGLILVFLLGFLLVWGLADGYSPAPADPNPDADVRIVALGDSFISGEGAGTFLDGTNAVGDDRNECRRAPTAHPYLLATELGAGLDFLACSGAKTVDLTECGQMERGPERCRPAEEWGPADASTPGYRPQLLALSPAQAAEADVVLLSIGGNDVGFSTIVQACLLPRSCDERKSLWLANVESLTPKLVATYQQVKATFPEVPVIVVPYPRMVDEATCNLGLDSSEHVFVIEFVGRLDAVIAQAAQEAGVRVVAVAQDAFAGHRLCDDDPASNHLVLDPPNGSPRARYLPSTWIHGSMHPNERGHELYAAVVGPEVEAALADVTAGRPANPDPVVPDASDGDVGSGEDGDAGDEAATPSETATAVTLDAVEADELLSDGRWITDELYRTVRRVLFPILLLLVGSLVLAIGVANLPGGLCSLLRPTRTWRNHPADGGPGATGTPAE